MPTPQWPYPELPQPHFGVFLCIYEFMGSDQCDGRLYASQVADLRIFYPHLGVIRASLEWLADNAFLVREDLGTTEQTWVLSAMGAEIGYRIHGAMSDETFQVAHSSGADSNWSPLALEHDNDAAEYAISRTEELVERVRGENGFAATEPNEHAATLWSLQTGLDAIKNRRPSRAQIESLLLAPMRWLSDKFTGAAIGELAKLAIQSLHKWIS